MDSALNGDAQKSTTLTRNFIANKETLFLL